MKITAEQLMHKPIVTAPDTTIIDSIRIMDKNNIGSLLICDKDEVLGIVTEEDILRYFSEYGEADQSKNISEIMTTSVYTVEFDCGIDEISKTLQEYHIRRLGVTRNGKVVGILTTKDVVTKYYTTLLKAEDIMEKPVFLDKDTSVKDAVSVIDKKIGCVFVKDLNGIVTEKDILNKVILKNIDYNKITIKSIMSQIDKNIEFNTDLNDIVNVFRSSYVRRLPVTKNHEVIGVVTTVNLLKYYHSFLAKAGDIMRSPVFISPNTSLKESAKLISAGMSGFAIVSEVSGESNVEEKDVSGIVTERDILRSISKNLDFDKVKISAIMSKEIKTVDVDSGVNKILELFLKHNIRRLPVTKTKYVVGMLGVSDLMWPYYISNVLVEDIMKQPLFEDPDKSAFDIVKTMSLNSIGSVLIEKKGEVLGILTEEDIIHKVISECLDPSKVKASEIMTKTVHTADCNMDINKISKLFDKYQVRRIPLTKNGKIVGIVTPRSFF